MSRSTLYTVVGCLGIVAVYASGVLAGNGLFAAAWPLSFVGGGVASYGFTRAALA